jgi:hypothetical protein
MSNQVAGQFTRAIWLLATKLPQFGCDCILYCIFHPKNFEKKREKSNKKIPSVTRRRRGQKFVPRQQSRS